MDSHASIASDLTAGVPATGSIEQLKILVVDDSKTILAFTAALLSHADFDVRTSDSIWISGAIAEFKPDLVLMDVNMGPSKGTNAVMALRDKSIMRGTRVVLHSSLPEEELQELVAQCGADGYIRKTQDPEALLRQVNSFLTSCAQCSVAG